MGQTGGRLEAGWRQAGGRLEGVHVRMYTFLAKLEAGWRQLEGVHVRIYTFLAKLEAGWRAFT